MIVSYHSRITSGSEFVESRRIFPRGWCLLGTVGEEWSTAVVVGIMEQDKLVFPFLLTGMCAQVAFFNRQVSGLKFWSCTFKA